MTPNYLRHRRKRRRAEVRELLTGIKAAIEQARELSRSWARLASAVSAGRAKAAARKARPT